MRIVAYTERGRYHGAKNEYSPAELEAIRKGLEIAASGRIPHFSFEIEGGIVIIGQELLKTAVFVIED